MATNQPPPIPSRTLRPPSAPRSIPESASPQLPPRIPLHHLQSQVNSAPPVPTRCSVLTQVSEPSSTEMYMGTGQSEVIVPQRDATFGARLQSSVQNQAGEYAATSILKPENQKAVGVQIASQSDNKLVASLAKNEFVQKQVGEQLSKAARSPECQKKVGSAIATQAKAGFKSLIGSGSIEDK